MAEKSKKPAIRFAGFTDACEQRKVGDFVDITTGKLDANAMKEDGKYDFYTSGIQKYKIDIFAFEGPAITIAGNGATVGYMHLVDGKFNAYQRTYVITGFQADRQFLFFEIGNKLPKKISQEARTGNIPYIVMDMLTELQILIPKKSEQEKIGQYVQHLDNLITLHQRKYDKLVNVKKAMLEKMFPKDGADVPEIRFKGFTEAWEQRKLGDIVDRVVRKNTNNESMLVLTISAQYGLVDQITYFNNRVASRDVSNYFLVLNGEFAYNKSTSDGYPFGAVKRLDLYDKGVLSTLYIVFVPKSKLIINSNFLTVFFDTDRWYKGVSERAAEGARNHGLLNISAEDFFDIDIVISKYIEEQKQIGELFRSFDNLITLHQRKLEKLKNLKKACLEKMFV